MRKAENDRNRLLPTKFGSLFATTDLAQEFRERVQEVMKTTPFSEPGPLLVKVDPGYFHLALRSIPHPSNAHAQEERIQLYAALKAGFLTGSFAAELLGEPASSLGSALQKEEVPVVRWLSYINRGGSVAILRQVDLRERAFRNFTDPDSWLSNQRLFEITGARRLILMPTSPVWNFIMDRRSIYWERQLELLEGDHLRMLMPDSEAREAVRGLSRTAEKTTTEAHEEPPREESGTEAKADERPTIKEVAQQARLTTVKEKETPIRGEVGKAAESLLHLDGQPEEGPPYVRSASLAILVEVLVNKLDPLTQRLGENDKNPVALAERAIQWVTITDSAYFEERAEPDLVLKTSGELRKIIKDLETNEMLLKANIDVAQAILKLFRAAAVDLYSSSPSNRSESCQSL